MYIYMFYGDAVVAVGQVTLYERKSRRERAKETVSAHVEFIFYQPPPLHRR